MQDWQAELGLGSGSDSVWVGLITQVKGFLTCSSLLKGCLQLLFLQLPPVIPSNETVKGRLNLWSRLFHARKSWVLFHTFLNFFFKLDKMIHFARSKNEVI